MISSKVIQMLKVVSILFHTIVFHVRFYLQFWQTSVIRYSFQFSRSVVSDSLWPHGLQYASLSINNSRSLLKWMFIELVMPFNHLILCHPLLLLPQSFLASGSFQMSQFFTLGGQSIEPSASVLPMNIQNWFPLEWTGLISLQSKGLSRVFSNTTVQNHQFFSSHIHAWLLEKQ